MSVIKLDILKAKKSHVKALSTFEINVPVAYETVNLENSIKFNNLIIRKHKNINSIKTVYNQLKENYERECGDLEYFCDPDIIYLFIMPLMNPGLQLSKKFRYIGFVEVYEDIIQLVWMHPFLRNRGLMTEFFLWYACNENMLSFQPPISKQMQFCLNKTEKIILSNENFKNLHSNMQKKLLLKKNPKIINEIESLNRTEIQEIISSIEVAHVLNKKEGKKILDKVEIEKIIEILVKSKIFLKSNPDALEELDKWAKENVNIDELKDDIKKFRDQGY